MFKRLNMLKTFLILILFNSIVFASKIQLEEKIATRTPSTTTTSRFRRCPNFDPKLKICCNGVIQDRIGSNPMCCGFNSFDSTWKICCNGVIHDKKGSKPMCCGSNAYDSTWNTCCNGVIQEKPFGFYSKCCSSQAYDPTSFMCCRNVLIKIPFSTKQPKCCGIQVYDNVNQYCCSGEIKDVCD